MNCSLLPGTFTHGQQKYHQAKRLSYRWKVLSTAAAIYTLPFPSSHLTSPPSKVWQFSESSFPHQENGDNPSLAPVSILWNDGRPQGLLTLHPPQKQFPLSFSSLFGASILGFTWWKGFTSETLHLQLAPTGSVNDPSLARQTAEQQRTPEEFLGLEGEGSPCTKACQPWLSQALRQKNATYLPPLIRGL